MKSKVILVHSFKGGTGKTLTSINLAHYLNKMDKKVLAIESDFSMSAFQSIFDEYNPDIFINDYLKSSETKLHPYIYPDSDSNFGVVFCDDRFKPTDKIHSNDQNWFRSKKKQLQTTIENIEHDFIIFDTQPGIHLFTINIITISDEIVLMLRPDMQSMYGTQILLDKIYTRSLRISPDERPRFTLLFNQVPNIEEISKYLDQWTNELKTKFDIIDKIEYINYSDRTSFHTAIQEFILPENDPTKKRLSNIFSYLIR